jgi:hypothetical protein
MQTKTTPAGELHELVRWRREQLVQSGFSLPLAARLASDDEYDLHALIELAERGCPPDLAVRILAPLAAESAA